MRTGLKRRVLGEIYQMLKKGEYRYGRDPVNHEGKMAACRRFLAGQKKKANLKNPPSGTEGCYRPCGRRLV
jgi:hypothetical protein